MYCTGVSVPEDGWEVSSMAKQNGGHQALCLALEGVLERSKECEDC